MKKIEIKHRFTGAVLFTGEVADNDALPVRTALKQAILAGADLADADLAGADLADADLAGADLAGAYLAGAYLAGAYLARADLAGADLAGAYLAGAYLAYAYLAYANLRSANLSGANLSGAYLSGAYLAGADLAGADLAGAYLAGADLADANGLDLNAPRVDPPEPYKRLTTPEEIEAVRLADMKRYRERHPEVPVIENLDRRILDEITREGQRLEMGSWHGGESENGTACGTTHCRGGWAVHLAGKAGYELERSVGVQNAAAMIYRASTGRVPHFYATNESALADIKRCAGVTP